MRIVSPFHDYYDRAMGHGADLTLVYQRKTAETEGCHDNLGFDPEFMPQGSSFFDYRNKRYETRYRFSSFLILFCGQVHRLMTLDYTSYGIPESAPTRYLWSAEAVHAAVADTPEPVQAVYRRRGLDKYDRFTRHAVEAFFAAGPSYDAACVIHHRHASPVILYRPLPDHPGVTTIVDPVLKDLHFFQVKDAFAAYQDIAGFLGGVLRSTERDTVEISDRDRIAKHGFDKWSFRKKSAEPKPA